MLPIIQTTYASSIYVNDIKDYRTMTDSEYNEGIVIVIDTMQQNVSLVPSVLYSIVAMFMSLVHMHTTYRANVVDGMIL